MREFELIIDDALKNGLSPIDNPPVNSHLLKECLGFRCADDGVEVYEVLTNPFPSSLSLDYVWPFPQVVVGEGYTILAEKDAITGYIRVYKVSDDHQVITQLFESMPVLHPATLLEVADFGKFIFMTTGSTMVYFDVGVEVWQRAAELDTIPTMRTICNFKGQAVGGCVLSDWYDCDETFYAWSAIGSIDFTLGKDNEAGYRRCLYGGTVYHTRRLGDAIVGYSSEGITLIHPGSSAVPEYGTGATFGFRGLSGVGLINRGAVCGDEQRQVYVGEDYVVRSITSKGIEELGFKSYMKELGESIIVTFDKSKKDFYIGNSSKTFLLSPQGMSEILQHPSTVWRKNKQTHCLPPTEDSDNPYIVIRPFNMGYGGEKTIFTVESDAFDVTGSKAGVDWIKDLKTWNSGAYKPINNEGIALYVIAGNSFRFKLKFDSLGDKAKINYVKVRYKMTDLRGIRGVHSPPPRGQGV